MRKKFRAILKLLATAITCLLLLIYFAKYTTTCGHVSNSKLGRRTSHLQPKQDISDVRGIMIGIIVTQSKGCTEFTASILRNYHQINDEDIRVFVNVRSDHTQIELTRWYGDNIDISSFDPTAPLKKPLEVFVQSNYRTLFLIDSETVFLPNWDNFVSTSMIYNKIPFLSLYHSSYMHSFNNDCDHRAGELCEGKLKTNLGVALSHAMAQKIMLKHLGLLGRYNWDEILKREKLRSLYPRKSLVINIGQKHQGKDFCGENDVPYGFNLCALPMWIQNGIEFYFDRCTNPEERYLPEISIKQANKNKRLWTRPAISYSLYGSKTRYTDGALENSKRVFNTYPGWKVWVFIDESVPNDIVDRLCEQNVKLVNMSGGDIRNKMSWRFLIASEPVKMYAIRDIDSRLLPRGKAAVDEWIKSGRKFHVMRDHPNHSRHPMSGGMWGGRTDAIPDMADLIKSYGGQNRYMVDMNFLNGVVWEIANRSVWVHDSHSLHKFGEDHPFLSPWNPRKFVGKINFV